MNPPFPDYPPIPPARAAESPSTAAPPEPEATLAPAFAAGAAGGGHLTPVCLRCRYDLSGAAAAWTTQCPLEGTCPECGGVVDFGKAYEAAARVPWAFDGPAVQGLALGKWWRTTARVLLPHRFWQEMRHAPLAPGRLALWVVCLVWQFHAVCMMLGLMSRANETAAQTRAGWPTPFWGNTEETLRLLFYPIYAGARNTPAGGREPILFINRLYAALAVASLAAAILLLLNRFTTRREPYIDAPLARAAVYGMLPLGLMYVFAILFYPTLLAAQLTNVWPQWWFGNLGAPTFSRGADLWVRRAIDLASVVWLIAWWWHAAKAAYTGPRPTRIRIACVGIALATAAAMYGYFMWYWDAWLSL